MVRYTSFYIITAADFIVYFKLSIEIVRVLTLSNDWGVLIWEVADLGIVLPPTGWDFSQRCSVSQSVLKRVPRD